MQYKIPQNVQIEDKIVGPLTFKQLIILGVGGGISYTIYLTLAKQFYVEVWLPIIAPIVLITLALAFVKPLGVDFSKYIALLLEFFLKPRKRMWLKGEGDVYISAFTSVSKQTKVEKKASKKRSKDRLKFDNIEEITTILDSHGKHAEGVPSVSGASSR